MALTVSYKPFSKPPLNEETSNTFSQSNIDSIEMTYPLVWMQPDMASHWLGVNYLLICLYSHATGRAADHRLVMDTIDGRFNRCRCSIFICPHGGGTGIVQFSFRWHIAVSDSEMPYLSTGSDLTQLIVANHSRPGQPDQRK